MSAGIARPYAHDLARRRDFRSFFQIIGRQGCPNSQQICPFPFATTWLPRPPVSSHSLRAPQGGSWPSTAFELQIDPDLTTPHVKHLDGSPFSLATDAHVIAFKTLLAGRSAFAAYRRCVAHDPGFLLPDKSADQVNWVRRCMRRILRGNWARAVGARRSADAKQGIAAVKSPR